MKVVGWPHSKHDYLLEHGIKMLQKAPTARLYLLHFSAPTKNICAVFILNQFILRTYVY